MESALIHSLLTGSCEIERTSLIKYRARSVFDGRFRRNVNLRVKIVSPSTEADVDVFVNTQLSQRRKWHREVDRYI